MSVLRPADEFVSRGIDSKHDHEEQDAHDEEGAIMDATERDFAEFLGDDAGEGVGGL